MSAPIFGHEQVRMDLMRAHRADHLPQVILITGEPGVGKQTLGRWLGGLLLCTSRDQSPCGACQPCRLVAGLGHPDFHWFVPIPRPKASDPAKQVEEVQEALGELLAARRAEPVYQAPDGMAMHGVASARLVLRTASLTTVMGGRRVILIGDADRLVPQESSPEAANALLKLLEEPPAGTTIVLTTTDPARVLPTIRSRAVPVRLGRLADREVAQALAVLAPNLTEAERRDRVAAAEGSIGKALAGARAERADDQVAQLLAAVRQGGPARFERILRQGPWAARGEFTTLLDGLTETLGSAARAASGGGGRSAVPAALGAVEPVRMLRALERVDAAREAAQTNVNPQLLLATLTAELAEALWA